MAKKEYKELQRSGNFEVKNVHEIFPDTDVSMHLYTNFLEYLLCSGMGTIC